MRTLRLAMLALLVSTLAALLAPALGASAAAPQSSTHPDRLMPHTGLVTSFGMAGQGGIWQTLAPALIQAESNAGVHYRLLELDWKDLQPAGPGDWSSAEVASVQSRIEAILATAPDTQFYLDLGLQYPPAWAAAIDPLVDQFGHVWQASPFDGGGANVYWSPTLQGDVRGYLHQVFTTIAFHNHLWAVRVGPYVGEMMYPDRANPGAADSFWAFDATAQASSPVRGWHPGQASPNGEATRFYNWYVDNLAHYFNFMLTEVRHYYSGYVAPVTAGLGVTTPALANIIGGNLYDPAEQHVGTGNNWYRIFPQLGPDPNILQWCSSVGDGTGSDETSPDWWNWSSAKTIAWMAQQNGRLVYGENPGQNAYDTSGGADPQTTMQWIFGALHNYGYLGVMWVREEDMTNPSYASLPQYGAEIGQSAGCGSGFVDVAAGSPFYTVIGDLVTHGAISGYGDCTFRPNTTITRGQATKVTVLGLGLPLINPPGAHFNDVPPGSAFYTYVETAYARHMISGYGDGSFQPNQPITRGDVAKLAVTGRGWALVQPATATFTDVPPSHPLYTFVETAVQHALISGYGCGSGCLQFRPAGTATRGQGSKIIDVAITAP